MTWGLVAVAGATLTGAVISSSASKSAANAQVAGANQAAQVQQGIFNTTQANLAPYMDAGKNSLPALLQLLGLKSGTPGVTGTGQGGAITAGDIDPSKLSAGQLGDVNSYFTNYVRDQLKNKYAANPGLLVPGAVGGGAPGADGKVAYDPNNINVDITKPGWDLNTLQSQYPGFDLSKIASLQGTPSSFDPNSPLLKAFTPYTPPPVANAPPTVNQGQALAGPNYTPVNLGSLTVPQFTPWAGFSVPGVTDTGDFTQSPGYSFARDQGINAITNSAAKSGGAMGGNTLKAIGEFTTGLANQDFQNWFNDKLGSYQTNYGTSLDAYKANAATLLGGYGAATDASLASDQQKFAQSLQSFQTNSGLDQAQRSNIFNMINSLITGGQNAAAGQGTIGASTGANIAGSITGGANAAAAGTIGGANALSGGINNLSQMFFLNQLLKGGPGGGGGSSAVSALYGSGYY